MENPDKVHKSPYKIKVEKGKKYSWCSCGLSKKQPFCDEAHKEEGKFGSVKYIAEENKEIYFCGCKSTQRQSFCDGTH